MRRYALLVVAAGLLIAADTATDDVKKEKDKLKGTWNVVSLETGGEKGPEEFTKGATLTFEDEKATFKAGGENHLGTYKIDPGKKQKTIDIIPSDGPDKDKAMQGI